jgi:uncharacterized membrane protein HdeD (DUF308 family)
MNGIAELRKNWPWILTFGCLSIFWGMLAIAYSVMFTLVSVLVFAWLLIVGGLIEGVQAIRHRERGHLLFYLLESLLAIVAGVLLLRSPETGALVITLLIASYFVVIGIFRIAAAIGLRLPNWGWTLTNGVITLLLGIIVWGGWPVSAMWVLGLFIGINLVFTGFAQVMLALALKSHHAEALPA